MKAILIDPFNRIVTEVERETFKLDDIYELTRCDCITTVYLGARETMFIDDEGLFNPKESMEYFTLKGANQPFAGCGLILGTDNEGDSASTGLTLEQVMSKVAFLDKANVNPDEYIKWEFYAL